MQLPKSSAKSRTDAHIYSLMTIWNWRLSSFYVQWHELALPVGEGVIINEYW